MTSTMRVQSMVDKTPGILTQITAMAQNDTSGHCSLYHHTLGIKNETREFFKMLQKGGGQKRFHLRMSPMKKNNFTAS